MSAVVLAPPAAVAIYLGFPWFDLMVAALALLVAIEWAALIGIKRRRELSALVGATAVAGVLAVAAGRPGLAPAIAVAGAAAALIVARHAWPGKGAWAALGVLSVVLSAAAFVWLRGDPAAGRATVLWLVCVVWAADIGAYVAGRAIGGPRLAPTISPGKTWAGLAGAVVLAVVVGAVAGFIYAPDRLRFIMIMGLMSAALALIAEAGDLAESKLKRHFGVKDSGTLIPGHGGALDRLDGMLPSAPAIALLHMISGGSPFQWL
ncbi:MAG: phosphatidate cytidylyltransferase [Kiloniellales bacterium]